MRHRVSLRIATVAVAFLLSGSAATVATASGSGSSKQCPTHKHQGEHNGFTGDNNGNSKVGSKNSKNKGGSHGNKCGIPSGIR